MRRQPRNDTRFVVAPLLRTMLAKYANLETVRNTA